MRRRKVSLLLFKTGGSQSEQTQGKVYFTEGCYGLRHGSSGNCWSAWKRSFQGYKSHKPHQTQEVLSPDTAGSRQSTRKEVSHRFASLLLVHKPLHIATAKRRALGWLVPYFDSGWPFLPFKGTHTAQDKMQWIVPYAFFPNNPYHRHSPQILHILQSWKLCHSSETCSPPPCAWRGREDKRTQKLWKTPPLIKGFFSFFNSNF